jgi:C4-dicarboxylate-specific signal transduction histidine kinase
MNDVAVAAGVALTTDLSRDESIPYFLWDDPMTVRELRERLGCSEADRIRLLGKILREAREQDVWLFTTAGEVDQRWDQLERHLGRRKDFWRFLLGRWREQGLLI